jgi:hypothetical protein
MACAQAFFSFVEWPRDRSAVRLVTFDESEIWPVERRLVARRAAALARYERRGSGAPAVPAARAAAG